MILYFYCCIRDQTPTHTHTDMRDIFQTHNVFKILFITFSIFFDNVDLLKILPEQAFLHRQEEASILACIHQQLYQRPRLNIYNKNKNNNNNNNINYNDNSNSNNNSNNNYTNNNTSNGPSGRAGLPNTTSSTHSSSNLFSKKQLDR